MKHNSPGYLRISLIWIYWIFGAYEAWISWIFGAYEVLLSRYLWISWIFRAYEAWISWIFGAYEAQITCIFVNIRDIQARAYKAQIVYLWTFVAYEAQISEIWGLWRTNHVYICESQGYLGPESPVYLQISWTFANLINIQGLKEHESPRYSRISWIFLYHLEILNLLDNLESPGYWGSMKCKSTGYS